MLPEFISRALRIVVPVLALLLCCAADAAAQRTGEWVVVDGRHEGRFNTVPRQVEGASRGHYVVLTREDASFGPFTIRRTTDGGTSWTVVRADSGTNFTVFDIAHPSNDLIIAVGDTTSGTAPSSPWMVRSTDGGSTWSHPGFASGYRLTSIAMANPLSGGILGLRRKGSEYEYALFTTSDGGATWTQKTIGGTQYPNLLYARGPGSYVITAYDASSKLVLMRSSDDGSTWETGPLPAGVAAIDFIDPLVGWGAGGIRTGVGDTQRDVLVRTTDGGATWTTVIDSLIDFRLGLSDVDFADKDHGIAVGGYGKILRTTDGGVTWWQDWPPSYMVAELVNFSRAAYPVPDEALTITTTSSYVLRYTGRSRLAAPKITEPSTNLNDLPIGVTVAWTPIDGAQWYDLQVGDTTYEYNFLDHRVFDVPYIDEKGLTTTSYQAQLQPEARYTFRVRARGGSDTSDWSNRVYALSRIPGQLGIPLLTLPTIGAVGVAIPTRFEWTEVPDATGYDLVVGDQPGMAGTPIVSITGHAGTSYTAANLAPNTVYFAWVRARSASSVSEWSNLNQGAVQFTTGAVSGVRREIGGGSHTSVGPNPTTDGIVDLVLTRQRGGDAVVLLCDLRGNRLATLFDGTIPAGSTVLPLDLTACVSGTYYLIVEEGSERVMEKIEIVR